LQSLNLKSDILVVDGSQTSPLPQWSAALIWLGAWCRKHQFMDKRLITFAVLPTRELAAAFACVGSLIAGAELFEETFSWNRFSCLPRGSKVFWKTQDGRKHYRGNIIGIEIYGGSEFIVLKVLKAQRRAEVGSTFKVSKKYFDDYRFSEEQPPNTAKKGSFHNVSRFMSGLLENINSKWIWTDGSEGILITSMANFDKTISDVFLKINEQQALPLRDILCIEINGGPEHAKLRKTHPRGDLSGNFPLVILDGPDAFHIHEHFEKASNVLVILDRSEYQEGIHGTILQLKSVADTIISNKLEDIPDNLPPGIELAAYVINRS